MVHLTTQPRTCLHLQTTHISTGTASGPHTPTLVTHTSLTHSHTSAIHARLSYVPLPAYRITSHPHPHPHTQTQTQTRSHKPTSVSLTCCIRRSSRRPAPCLRAPLDAGPPRPPLFCGPCRLLPDAAAAMAAAAEAAAARAAFAALLVAASTGCVRYGELVTQPPAAQTFVSDDTHGTRTVLVHACECVGCMQALTNCACRRDLAHATTVLTHTMPATARFAPTSHNTAPSTFPPRSCTTVTSHIRTNGTHGMGALTYVPPLVLLVNGCRQGM